MSAVKDRKRSPGRTCFVTVGATAAFPELIRAILDSSCLKRLSSLGYTQLRVQYGKDGESTVAQCLGLDHIDTGHLGVFYGIDIYGFDFKHEGIEEDMAAARGSSGREGVVISHAGTGSILAAMRIDVLLIVVANSALLHNHQEDLAVELANSNYLVHGSLGNLPAALDAAEKLRERRNVWPPPQSSNGVIDILDEEMGFVD